MNKWKILAEYHQHDDLITQLLKTRGIASIQEKDLFLNPPRISYWLEELPKDLLISLKKARGLIQDTIKNKQFIIIHGDYDADGICATSILYNTLHKELGYEYVIPFVPNRFEHGYGLSSKFIKACLEKVEKSQKKNLKKEILMITVDNGITSVEEVSELKKLGHKIIIVDHHQKPNILPDADCIVWNDEVVGATLAFLISVVFNSKNKDNLVYAGIATVTDLQILKNFNRTLVKNSLEIINQDPPLSIKTILDFSGRKPTEVTTYDLGWVIGPRLNASGRVVDASHSLNLLIEDDPIKIENLSWELNKVNLDRQDKTTQMYELADNIDPDNLPSIIFSHHDDYHEGIIGLIASKLTQKYHRPAIVISTSSEISKGSVRSITGINIIGILRELDDLFINLGGHPMAAGFSIEKNNIALLKEKIFSLINSKTTPDLFEKILEIDLQIPLKEITHKFIKDLDLLKPYGLGNEQPIFCSQNIGIGSLNVIESENNHLTFKFFDGMSFYKGIYFNAEDILNNFQPGDYVDIAYNLKENNYQGVTSFDLILKDIKKTSK